MLVWAEKQIESKTAPCGPRCQCWYPGSMVYLESTQGLIVPIYLGSN